MYAAHVPTSVTVTITAGSTTVTNTLKPNVRYVLIASTTCWVAQGVTAQVAAIGGATASMPIPANVPVYIWGNDGAFLTVIGTAGTLTVTACAE